MTVKEASTLLGCNEQTLRLAIQQGKFGYCIHGRGKNMVYFVNETEVRTYAALFVRPADTPM